MDFVSKDKMKSYRVDAKAILKSPFVKSLPVVFCCTVIFFEFALLHYLTLQTDLNNRGITYHLLMLNVLFCASCYIWIKQRFAWVVLNIVFLAFLQVCTLYFYFFKSPLSASTIVSQYEEALNSYFISGSILTNKLTLLYLFTFFLKLALIFLNNGYNKSGKYFRYTFPLGYLLLSTIGWFQIDPMKNIRYWKDFGNLASSHGYFQTWLGELFYFSDSTFKEEYIRLNANARHAYNGDLARDLQHCGVPKHVVIMQLESVDWRTLNTNVDGAPMMPTLAELGSKGSLFEMETIHIIGSLDTDFTILTNRLPSDKIASYKLNDLDLKGNLIEYVNEAGFQSSILHPFRITYFDRDLVLNELPLDRKIFSEDMHEYLRHSQDGNSDGAVQEFTRGDNRVVNVYGFRDSDMFNISQKLFESHGSQQQFQYLISFRTHWPFRITDEIVDTNVSLEYDEPFNAWERYHHSALYLDSLIEQYVNDLPNDTRFYIFGDHEAPIKFPKESGFTKEANTKPEYVPLILWQKGCDTVAGSKVEGRVKSIHLLELSDHLIHYFDSAKEGAESAR